MSAALLAPHKALAQATQLTLTVDAPTGNLSWNAVTDPSSGTAVVTYYVYVRAGFLDPTVSGGSYTPAPFTVEEPGVNLGSRIVGSYCYDVRATSTVTPLPGIADSGVVCHSFLHSPGGGNVATILRADADGTQEGFNQTWNFSYYLDDDAYMNITILPPNATFTAADPTTGFFYPAAADSTVDTVVGGVPRSGELNTSPFFENTDTWGSRNSSGATVSNGLYIAYFSAYNPLLPGTTVYTGFIQVPVDIIRFTAFATTALNTSNTVADINFTITANCNFRAVIAQPGHQFTIDSSGNVQALNLAGTAIDTSSASVVQVLTGSYNYGANTVTWNGTNLAGVAVSSGVYPIGLSATDTFGNQALNLSGNNGPLIGTITDDRVPGQTGTTGTAPSVSSITVNGTALTLSGGTNVVSPFSSVNITLNSAGDNGTTVTLTGPNGSISGNTVVTGTQVVFSTTTSLASTGTYTVTVNPSDVGLPGPQQVTFFNLVAAAGPSVTSISVGPTSLTLGGGTTVAAPFSVITVVLSATAGSSTTVTLNGPAGLVAGSTASVSGSATVTFTPTVAVSTAGAYTVTVNPYGTTTNPGTPVNTAFTVSTTGGASSSASGSSQSSGQLASSLVPYPNPNVRGNNCITISFQTLTGSDATIDIYTLTGSRALHQTVSCPGSMCAAPGSGSPAASNNCSFKWNLANDQGSTVADGVYNVHITVNNTQGEVDAWKKIMVIK